MNDSIIFYDSQSRLINPLDNPFFGKTLVELAVNAEDEAEIDSFLTGVIESHLITNSYTNIILPLCFGNILSDFLGLRLAAMIRCTSGNNQKKNIFIYSFTGIRDLFSNECFNILRTEGVFLIDYSIPSILEAASHQDVYLSQDNLVTEVAKLNLNIPLDFQDNHSIANVWAIYQWSEALELQADDSINERIKNDLYFKYLKTIHFAEGVESNTKLKIENANKDITVLYTDDEADHSIRGVESNPKLKIESGNNDITVLYIDDEAEKGWFRIFSKILVDVNSFDLAYLGDQLLEKDQEQIIEKSIEMVEEENPDVVILDLRLHKDDFNDTPITKITGYKILEEIKKYNKGIQVIIFSATNKIWNLQALQAAGADDFINKGSIHKNSVGNPSSAIETMVSGLKEGIKRSFLKHYYNQLDIVRKDLIPRTNNKSMSPLPKEMINESLKWFEMSRDILSQDVNNLNITAAFLFLFSVLENISNFIIDSDNPYEVNDGGSDGPIYEYEFRKKNVRLKYFSQHLGKYQKTNIALRTGRSIPWAMKILNTLDYFNKTHLAQSTVNDLVTTRNNIVHANSTTGVRGEVSLENLHELNKIVYEALRSI